MTATILEYDPNIRWGTHTVEIELRRWQYAGTFTVELSGNCTGNDVIEGALDEFCEEYADRDLTLTAPNGDELLMEADYRDGDEDLLRSVVSVRILNFTPEAHK